VEVVIGNRLCQRVKCTPFTVLTKVLPRSICTLKVVQFDQTFTLATSIVVRSEEVRHRYKRQSSFLLQVEVQRGNRIDCSFGPVFAR
jgi:hypothetical protein